MANLNGFDANTVEPTTEFDPVPAGKYLAVVAASEMKPTKSSMLLNHCTATPSTPSLPDSASPRCRGCCS